MKTLEQEAENYNTVILGNGRETIKQAFIAGATSKYVQAQILNAKIEGLLLANDNASGIMYRIAELEQELKKLEK